MRKIPIALVFSLLATRGATAQAPAPLHLPWDVPSAEAATRLEQAGFRRHTMDDARYVRTPRGSLARVPGDGSESTYRRDAAGVTESVFIRTRAGETVQMVFSAVGDSAALQAKLDAVAADQAGRSGTLTREWKRRLWTMEGGRRLSVPTQPFRLPDGATFQFMVLYYRP